MQRLRFSRLPDRQVNHHLAATRLPPGQTTFAHTHDFPEIFLVTGGGGFHSWNGRRLPLMRGSLAWVAPADRHYYFSGREHGLEFINLAFAPAWWTGFSRLFHPVLALPRQATGSPRWHRRLGESETAILEQELRTWLAAAPSDATRLVKVTAMLIGSLLTAPAGSRSAREEVPEWLAKWSMDLADPALVGEPLAFWQKRSGRSPEHLSRSCRRFFGVVPTDMLGKARIAQVQTRLRRGETKIATLAMDVGFQNLGYFYRTFRRIAGAPPRVWLAAQAAQAVVPR